MFSNQRIFFFLLRLGDLLPLEHCLYNPPHPGAHSPELLRHNQEGAHLLPADYRAWGTSEPLTSPELQSLWALSVCGLAGGCTKALWLPDATPHRLQAPT